MDPMNNGWDSQTGTELVKRYETLLQDNLPCFFEEKEFLRIVGFYETEEQWDRALEAVDHALNCYGYSTDLHLKKAQLLIEGHKEALALQVLEQAAIFDPSEPGITLMKAEALCYLYRYEEALELLENLKMGADAASLSDIYMIEALVYETQEEYERMFYALRAALLADFGNQDAVEKLGICMELSRKYKESIPLYEEVLDHNPYAYMAWYNLGHAHAYFSNYEEAIEAYEFAIAINDQYEFAFRDCADLCFELKQYVKALRYYLEIAELSEPDSDLMLHIGQCYQELGQNDMARDYYQRASQLDLFNDEAYYCTGQTFSIEENWKQALRFYKRAIQIDYHREEYHAAIAWTYHRLGQKEDADRHYREAIELAPEESNFWLEYAGALLETNRLDEALELLEEGSELTAETELLYCRIACLFAAGKRQEAIYWLGEALAEAFDKHKSLFEWAPALENDSQVMALIASYSLH
ncbi:MAG: tetratricopeptide repeat protein [Saprospiraceae bacterium]|nr:tetratricopeptide repeat protein [Saprospiraceae bacterium]